MRRGRICPSLIVRTRRKFTTECCGFIIRHGVPIRIGRDRLFAGVWNQVVMARIPNVERPV